jgi:hypothetical protein
MQIKLKFLSKRIVVKPTKLIACESTLEYDSHSRPDLRM